MVKMYYDKDANWDMMKDKTVAIIGYGSQGHAHALNLKDSGANVVVGLYEGSKSWAKAEAAGLRVMTAAEATIEADIVMMLIPDEKQASTYKKDVAPNLRPGMALAFVFILTKSFRLQTWTYAWLPLKDLDPLFVVSSPKARAYLV